MDQAVVNTCTIIDTN